jgi:long-subunit acyl-CoA synthetase (AMP-forming)
MPEVRIVRLEDVERAGSREPRAHTPPRPSSVATISYTSGTTGTPKGTTAAFHSAFADIVSTMCLVVDCSLVVTTCLVHVAPARTPSELLSRYMPSNNPGFCH